MSSSSSSLRSVFALLLLVISTFGHSQMRCANYDISTKKCLAPIRNQEESFQNEDNDMKQGGGICQFPMSNPISASYSNGPACADYINKPCPLPMGTIQQGQVFTVMWLARTHAVADEQPGKIEVYVSPLEQMNAGLDVSTSQFSKVCEAPFISCNGKNGDLVQCYANCTMPPRTDVGIHTIWWKWVWNSPGHDSIYTTCADIYVTASSSQPSIPPVVSSTSAQSDASSTSAQIRPSTTSPISTPPRPSTTTAQAAVSMSSTTAAQAVNNAPSTTAAQVINAPSTTSQSNMPPSTTQSPPVQLPPSSGSVIQNGQTPGTQGCPYGKQICTGESTFQTCTNAMVGTYWASPQSCTPGLSCRTTSDGFSVYCL